MNEQKNHLSEAQNQAVSHKDGPMLVLAGPGSGKTTVITKRTQVLIEQHGIHPGNILVITFTKAAAMEMQERFYQLMSGARVPVTFGTFHAVFFNILKYAYGYRAEHIIKEDEKYHFLKEYVQKEQIEIEDMSDFLKDIITEISLVKSENIKLEHYYSNHCPEKVFRNIYQAYEGFLRNHNLLDFDDMLIFTYELLTKRVDILQVWQKKYQYILIDEFQDINKMQYEIVKLLSKPENNLFAVGDDDQSIYRFRGAKPEIMLGFAKDYPSTKKVLLDYNYRSTGEIVRAAGNLISYNVDRFDKRVRAVKGQGMPIRMEELESNQEENSLIISIIREYQSRGVPLDEIAVLYRTNTQPGSLVTKLMEYNIPFRIKDGIPNLYDHWICKNIIAYIRIALGSDLRSDYLQIANRPNRYLNRECFRSANVSFGDIYQYYRDKMWMWERLDQLKSDLKYLSGLSPYSAITYIRHGIGYEEYLREYAGFRKLKEEELIEILDEIQENAKAFSTFEAWFSYMEQYREELKEQTRKKNKEISGVSLSTMHSSKGLEYQIVFIIDVNESMTPYRKASMEEDLEEERRLFYVAMTRAKEELFLLSVKKRYNKELIPSRFIGESLLNRRELQNGTLVEHKTYGEGVLQWADEKQADIYFASLNRQIVLDLNFCVSNRLLSIKKASGELGK